MEEIRVHRTAMSSQENQKSQDETTETSTVRNLRHRLIPTTDDEELLALTTSSSPMDPGKANTATSAAYGIATVVATGIAVVASVVALVVAAPYTTGSTIAGVLLTIVVAMAILGISAKVTAQDAPELFQKVRKVHKTQLKMVKTEQKRRKEAKDTRMLKSQPVIYQIERGNQQVHVQIAVRKVHKTRLKMVKTERRAEKLKMKQQLASLTSGNISWKRVGNGSNPTLTSITDGATEQKRRKEAEDTRMLRSQPEINQIEGGNQQVHAQIAELRAELLKVKQQLASLISGNLSRKRVGNGSNLTLTCITDGATEHEGVVTPGPVEAEAEDRLNVVDRTLSELSGTNTDEDSSESESPSTDSDYDEFSIPADLEERLNQLCVDQDVEDFLIHQNPEDYTDIVIEGKNANTISEEKLQAIRGEKELWGRYKISTRALVDGEIIHQFMSSQIKRFPMASLKGTCELLVEMDENNTEIVASAVGPAHMMFSEEMNRRLRDGVGLPEARDHIERTPEHTKYEMHFGPNEEERTTLAKYHPPMFGYRYRLSGEDNPRNAATSDESDDAETCQPADSPLYVSHSLCRNDMALFRLDYTQAEHMHDRLQSNIGQIAKMVDVKTMNQLRKYVRPMPNKNICIRVKGQRGVLVRHTLKVEKQRAKGEAYHLRFKLDDGELVEGDSGSIVFEEKSDGKMRPLGMFTGTVDITAFSRSYYQAVILSRALEDISVSYNLPPPGLQLFNTSGRDRTSSGQIRHRSTTQPPAAQSVPDGINDI